MKTIARYFVIFALIATVSNPLRADEDSDLIASKLQMGVMDGVGSYKIRVDTYGEPASLPLRVSVDVRCGMDEFSSRVFEDEVACAFDSFSKKDTNFVLKIRKINPQSEKCDAPELIEKSIASVCQKSKKKK